MCADAHIVRLDASHHTAAYAPDVSPPADADTDADAAAQGVEAWRMLLLAHAGAVRAIEGDVGRRGIPLGWYDVLLELNGARGRRLRMQELSDRVVLSRTRVSRLVDEMARQGLVEKQPDDTDRRSTWASITDDGRAALRRTAPVYLAGIEEHFAQHLTAAEQRSVAHALSKVVAAHSRQQVETPRLRR
jgi:DNA-binding MarR family transcriptional regulator